MGSERVMRKHKNVANVSIGQTTKGEKGEVPMAFTQVRPPSESSDASNWPEDQQFCCVPTEVLATLRGRRIAIPAPSYQLSTKDGTIDHARRERILEGIERFGMTPVLMGGVFEQDGRFAGSDARRAEDLQTAMSLPDIDLVMALRGGYGMTRLLDRFDWERLTKTTTPVIGYSDFTAFNLALLASTGKSSWHGPMASSFENIDPFTLERFAAVFGYRVGPLEWQTEKMFLGRVSAGITSYEGQLWGGNLCLIHSLIGTPWMPSVAKTGGMLFLEDVSESAYRVERMLLTLLDSGILLRQRAILLGSFTNADDACRFEGDHTLAGTFAYIRSRLPKYIPMVTGLPFGHVPKQATLPVGRHATFELEGASGKVRLDWV